MKKFLAILMTAAMIIGAFTFSVSADGETQSICSYCSKYHAVGARCDGASAPANSVTDGATSLNEILPVEATVTLELTGVNHRYAVDIEFDKLAFTYSAGQVWDVNDYIYVSSGTSLADPEVKTTVSITNHSDMPIGVLVNPLEDTSVATWVELRCEDAGGAAAGHIQNHTYKANIDGATPETKALTDKCMVRLAKKDGISDWNKVFEEFGKMGTEIKLGTITVTISAPYSDLH